MDDIAPIVVVVFLLSAMWAGVGLDRGLGAKPAGPTAQPPVLESGSISIGVAENRRVTATYVFDHAGTTGSARYPSNVSGTMWSFPTRDVGALSASVNGQAVRPSVTERGRLTRVSVPVPDDGVSGELSVRVKYNVSGPNGALRVPLWVPEFTPRGPDRSVAVRVRLPPGNTVRGTTFPRAGERTDNGRVLRYDLVHVPGFVSLQYGDGARRLPVGSIAGGAGVAATAVAAGAWWLLDKRRGRGRE